jgi:hypothetical protein
MLLDGRVVMADQVLQEKEVNVALKVLEQAKKPTDRRSVSSSVARRIESGFVSSETARKASKAA